MPMYEVDFAHPQGGYVNKSGVGLLNAAQAGAPTSSAAGYAKGCIYTDTTNGVSYFNLGTVSAAVWQPLGPSTPVNVTSSTLALTALAHGNRTVTINVATGCAITLPAATGTGVKFRIVIGTTVTTTSVVTITRAGSDTFHGMIFQLADGGSTLAAYECPGSTVITLGTSSNTTGGTKGDVIELEDIQSAVWQITGFTTAAGSEATPVT